MLALASLARVTRLLTCAKSVAFAAVRFAALRFGPGQGAL
jgi:hypothetical protein